MRGRKSYKRFLGVGVAIVLLAGSGMGVAIFLLAGRSQFPSASPRTVRAGDQREAKPMAADLVAAIRNADAQVVRKLLDNGADVNARDAEGNTPLILASFYASPECVELLIEKGADVNAANKAGATALIRAATSYEKTRLLVAAGANVQVRTALGNTPLILAARRAGNSRTVQLLLEHGADATERNDAGVSPVLSAAASGDVETVRLLLDAGAKADDFPKSNKPRAADAAAGLRTPLMWAALPQRCADGPPVARTRGGSESIDLLRQPVVACLLERQLRGGGIADCPRRERQRQGRGGELHALALGGGNRIAPSATGQVAAGQRRRSECGGRRTGRRVRTGAADPAADRRKARPDGDCRRPRGRRRQGPAAGRKNRHATTRSSGQAR